MRWCLVFEMENTTKINISVTVSKICVEASYFNWGMQKHDGGLLAWLESCADAAPSYSVTVNGGVLFNSISIQFYLNSTFDNEYCHREGLQESDIKHFYLKF